MCYSAGSIKKFATDASYDRGVVITSAWLANAVPVAEVSVALITLANKNWFECQDRIRSEGHDSFWSSKEAPHPGNFGATVGLIGMGAIGRMVAERLQSFDLHILAFDPYQSAERLEACGCEAVADLTELARRSDVVSLHAPNIPETEGMLDAAFFAAMRDNASFINTARGKLVVEDAFGRRIENRPNQGNAGCNLPRAAGSRPPVLFFAELLADAPPCWFKQPRSPAHGAICCR